MTSSTTNLPGLRAASRAASGVAPLVVSRIVLALSALVAVAIASAILIAPDAFYTGYGIVVDDNPTLANELKAPAGALLLAGIAMFVGVIRAAYVPASLALAAAVYLSYGASRIVSIALDGLPHDGMVAAAGIEIAIGTACLACWFSVRRGR